MPDYIAWYLVEIERHLGKIDPPQRVTDLSREVRDHLEQYVEELRSRGATDESAVKEAIIAFGHPRSVARGFGTSSRVSGIFYWAMIVLTLIVLAMMSRQFVISASSSTIGDSPGVLFSFGVFAAVGLGAVFVLSLLSKRWCVLPIALGCIALIAISGLFMSGEVDSYATDPDSGELLLLDEQNAQRQVSLRDLWLTEYEERIPSAQQSLALVQINLNFIRGEGPLRHEGQYVYPAKTKSLRNNPINVLPGLFDTTPFLGWSRIDPPTSGGYVLRLTESVEIASESWRVEGSGFFAYAEVVKNSIETERAVFLAPEDVSRTEIMKQTIGLPVIVVAFYSLLGLLINAVVVLLHWAVGLVRKREWRRQFS